ncbi:hypothetical protein [Streptomyces sp. NPDC051636]|uniref:hypothetical protein n=1 Tax=Streptomyces sp. NPDC051636 TaxID=3365663 RepID=UPI0037B92DB5
MKSKIPFISKSMTINLPGRGLTLLTEPTMETLLYYIADRIDEDRDLSWDPDSKSTAGVRLVLRDVPQLGTRLYAQTKICTGITTVWQRSRISRLLSELRPSF